MSGEGSDVGGAGPRGGSGAGRKGGTPGASGVGSAEENSGRRSARVAEWVVRVAFAAVFVLNVACALQFAFAPASFAGAYQLSGVAGEVAVRGIGVAFLMWNATYPLFVARPRRHMALGAIVLVQQAIGCVGETAILLTLPPTGFEVLASSILRFIGFDAAGLVVMAAAYAWLAIDRV